LLRKLGHLAGAGPDAARAAADVAVRRHAASLLTNWRLDDPNPTQYTGVLEFMADRNAMPASDADLAPDPLVILWTALQGGGARAPRRAAALAPGGRAALRAPSCWWPPVVPRMCWRRSAPRRKVRRRSRSGGRWARPKRCA